MKNLFIFLFLLSLMSCSSEESAEVQDIKTIEFVSKGGIYDVMFHDLMHLDAGGMFRGVDFDMKPVDIRRIERARPTASELSSEKVDELIVTTDLGEEVLDFADIKYTFDKNGLFFISVESFLETEEKAMTLYGMLNDYFTQKHGEAVVAVDGFLDFKTKTKNYDYQISIKDINFPPTEEKAGSYGFYLVYSMIENK